MPAAVKHGLHLGRRGEIHGKTFRNMRVTEVMNSEMNIVKQFEAELSGTLSLILQIPFANSLNKSVLKVYSSGGLIIPKRD